MRWLVLAVAACGSSATSAPPDKEPAPRTEPPASIPGIALAAVDAGFDAAAPNAKPRIVIAPTALTAEGDKIVALSAGAIAAKDLEDGNEFSMRIVALASWLAAHGAKTYGAEPRPPLVLALDRSITFQTLLRVMFTAKQREAGTWTRFSLLAQADGKLVAVPIALPTKTARRVSVSSGALPEDVVMARINSAYMAGIRRCYTDGLKRHPGLRGKVRLSFTVDSHGRATKPEVSGMPEIDACIVAAMAGWTFRAPDSDENATFAIALQLDDDAPPTTPPPAPPPPDAAPPPPEVDVRMVLSITREKMLLWSFSQLEGTLQHPLAELPTTGGTDQLRAALAGVIARRWTGKPRPADAKSIVIQPDADIPMSTLAPLIGAVRAGSNGEELFPEIQFSSGFIGR